MYHIPAYGIYTMYVMHLDIMNAFYYVPLIDEYAMLLLIVSYGYTCIYPAGDCSIRNCIHTILIKQSINACISEKHCIICKCSYVHGTYMKDISSNTYA